MINQKKIELGYELHEGDLGCRETDLDYEPKFLVDRMGIPTHILQTKKFRYKPNTELTKGQRKIQKKLIREARKNPEFTKKLEKDWTTPPPVQRLRK